VDAQPAVGKARWRIRAFGALQAECGDQVVTRFESRKVGALLTYLAWHGDRLHPREVLVELLWPEEPLDVGRQRFRQALSSLRAVLEPPGVPPNSVLVADRLQAGLAPGAVTTDLAEFEAALDAAARGCGEERIAALSKADDLYGGELLPGYYDEWILAARQRLAEAHREALGRLAQLEAERGDFPAAIAHARRAVRLDPLDEAAHRRVIGFLLEAGRPEEARRQYRALEQTLREELDAVPAPATRRLLEAPWKAAVGIAPLLIWLAGERPLVDVASGTFVITRSVSPVATSG
jgi:DNA-binding SARP family transcriptional activator